VVYCPRTHAYFGHGRYPLAEMLAAGVNVALGTDSRASSPDLNLLEEMRHAARLHPGVTPASIVRLGTLAGARALGRERRVGSLRPGKQADFVLVRLPDDPRDDPFELLLDATGGVERVYKSGVLL
jgi:cytosine/adenosine deaminase-related metal-dependent hydrolase